MIKSPLRYPGGKSRAIDWLSSLIPEDFEEYREAFIGGGSMYIYLKQRSPDRRYWINDLYFELYNFWQVSQKNLDSLINQINIWRSQFSNGSELFRFLKLNLYRFNDIEKAGAFFIFNRITFSGTTQAGGYSENAFKERFTESSIDRLKSLKNILIDTKITNLDYQKVIETPGKNVFLFLDPPYYSATESGLYGKSDKMRNTHKMFDHYRFANVMKKCEHKFLITYDDSNLIRKLFSFANITSWNLTYGMKNITDRSNQIGRELAITNYSIEATKDIQLSIDDAWAI